MKKSKKIFAGLSLVTGILLTSSISFAFDVTLSWNAVTGATGYQVYYDTDYLATGPPYNGTGALDGPSPIDIGNVTTFTLHGLPPSGYRFAITAYNNYGESGYSADASLPFDTDGDGLLDHEEINIYNTDPNNPDTDGDGIWDGFDAFPNNPLENSDNDNDNLGDNEDTDDDNDGVSDSLESIMDTDPLSAGSYPIFYEYGVEAESATTASPAEKIYFSNASAGEAVMFYRDEIGGNISFNIDIDELGTYYLWVHGISQFENGEFRLIVDDVIANPYFWDLPDSDENLIWHNITDLQGNIIPLYLEQGIHSFEIINDSKNWKVLDLLALTNHPSPELDIPQDIFTPSKVLFSGINEDGLITIKIDLNLDDVIGYQIDYTPANFTNYYFHKTIYDDITTIFQPDPDFAQQDMKFKIRAMTIAGFSINFDEIIVYKPAPPPTPPSAVQGLVRNPDGSFTWNFNPGSENITHYLFKWQYNLANPDYAMTFPPIPANVNTSSLPSNMASMPARVTVVAVGDNGEGDYGTGLLINMP